MRRSIALAAGLIIGSAGVALAESADGTVSQIDTETQMITLDSGDTIYVPDENDLTELRAGTRVTVIYEEEDGRNVAQSVVVQDPDSAQ